MFCPIRVPICSHGPPAEIQSTNQIPQGDRFGVTKLRYCTVSQPPNPRTGWHPRTILASPGVLVRNPPPLSASPTRLFSLSRLPSLLLLFCFNSPRFLVLPLLSPLSPYHTTLPPIHPPLSFYPYLYLIPTSSTLYSAWMIQRLLRDCCSSTNTQILLPAPSLNQTHNVSPPRQRSLRRPCHGPLSASRPSLRPIPLAAGLHLASSLPEHPQTHA